MQSLIKRAWTPGFSLETVPDPVAKEDEVIIRVGASAICGSDLHMYEASPGYEWLPLPVVPGHEVAGTVVEVGSRVGRSWLGRQVIVDPYIPCGRCANCLAGATNLCYGEGNDLDKQPSRALQIGFRRPGGMAEFLAAPERNLIPVPPGLSMEVAGLLESFAVSVHASFKVSPKPGDSALVLGPGPIGLGVAAVLASQGFGNVILAGLGVDAQRLETGRKLGVQHAVTTEQTNLADLVQDITAGRGIDFVFEASGHPAAVLDAVRFVRRGGQIVMVGISSKPVGLWANHIVRSEILLQGSYGTTPSSFRRAVTLAATSVNLQPLVSAVKPLEHADEAFRLALSKQASKVVMVPSSHH